MIDPTLYAGVPFQNYTALLDFAGSLQLYHQQGLIPAVRAVTGSGYRALPLGDRPGTAAWLHAVNETYVNAARQLGLVNIPDLESYDLTQEADFTAFLFQLSAATRQLRAAAKLR